MTKKKKPKCTPKNGKTHPWMWTQPTTKQHKEMLDKGDKVVPLGSMMGVSK